MAKPKDLINPNEPSSAYGSLKHAAPSDNESSPSTYGKRGAERVNKVHSEQNNRKVIDLTYAHSVESERDGNGGDKFSMMGLSAIEQQQTSPSHRDTSMPSQDQLPRAAPRALFPEFADSMLPSPSAFKSEHIWDEVSSNPSTAHFANAKCNKRDETQQHVSARETSFPKPPMPTNPARRAEVVTPGGVDLQALLENIQRSTAIAVSPAATAAAAAMAAPTPPSTAPSPVSPKTDIAQSSGILLPTNANLPPRPPPQEKPSSHPAYSADDDIRSFHPTAAPNFPGNLGSSYRPGAPGSSSNPASSQSANFPGGIAAGGGGEYRARDSADQDGPSPFDSIDEKLWTPEIQRKYDAFIQDEKKYVTDGQWDKFPANSRLFIGLALLTDLPCGNGTDLEMSKPQVNSRSQDGPRNRPARRSRSPERMRGGNGGNMSRRSSNGRRGRNAKASDSWTPQDDFRRNDLRMRSPSPNGVRMRGDLRGSQDRYVGTGRREGSRSRSPYGRNRADRYEPRTRSPNRIRNGSPIRNRSRSPHPLQMKKEDPSPNFAAPRENKPTPEVQLIVIDNLNREFVSFVDRVFKERGLRCDVFFMNARSSLQMVVKTYIVQGVDAIVRLSMQSQISGRIPLQLFDRSGVDGKVQFEEYDHLEPHIAAEIVFSKKATRVSAPVPAHVPTHNKQQQYGHQAQILTPPLSFNASGYGRPPVQPAHQMHPQPTQFQNNAISSGPNLTNLIASLNEPDLQKLLDFMQQQSAQAPSTSHATQARQVVQPQQAPLHHPQTHQSPYSAELASILESVRHEPGPAPPAQPAHHHHVPHYPQTQAQHNGGSSSSAQYPPHPTFPASIHSQMQSSPRETPQPFSINTEALASLLAKTRNVTAPPAAVIVPPTPIKPLSPTGDEKILSIMAQLAKWKKEG
ncbi:MAG: hypothetical protein M1829_006710 [Trizodia sp. TS-e1964]|nr:MAG: hypothetical protein M1829_006710 [Trizodia sp. TS-e1964]